VKKGQRNSSVMDSRGMVHLRLGHYKQAVADYDIALARQSRSAWSYLGRGLAKEHLGDTAGAQSDLKQALALDPDLTDAAHKIGLESDLLPKPKPEPGKTAGAAG
jgi:tetratricopeptide (TPR) repeat protein